MDLCSGEDLYLRLKDLGMREDDAQILLSKLGF